MNESTNYVKDLRPGVEWKARASGWLRVRITRIVGVQVFYQRGPSASGHKDDGKEKELNARAFLAAYRPANASEVRCPTTVPPSGD